MLNMKIIDEYLDVLNRALSFGFSIIPPEHREKLAITLIVSLLFPFYENGKVESAFEAIRQHLETHKKESESAQQEEKKSLIVH